MNVAKRRSEIVAAAVYLAAALVLYSYFPLFLWLTSSWPGYPYAIGEPLGATILLVSSVRIFMARRFGDLTALVGALLAWPYFRLVGFNAYPFSLWLAFNLPGESQYLRSQFLVVALTIFAISALLAATACSALRLTPKSWRIGKLALRDRAWPGFAITFVFVFVWYLRSVTMYRIPILDRGSNPPIVSILHVEKHGLQFHETYIAFYRDGQFYVAHDDHRLFQYSFQQSRSKGVLTDDYLRLLHELANSPLEFRGSDVASYLPPRAWNTDRWFVFRGRADRMAVNVDASVVPDEVSGLFYGAQKLPQERVWEETARDVCFGFRYDPTR